MKLHPDTEPSKLRDPEPKLQQENSRNILGKNV